MAQPNKKEPKEVLKKADEAGTGEPNLGELKYLMLSMETEERKK